MDHKKALDDKLQKYANFHMSQIRNVDSEYHDSDDDLDPDVEGRIVDDSPVIKRTLSNSSRFSKEQLILDANRSLKSDSLDRSCGTSTPTSGKKKSVVIIAPRTSSFTGSVSSRASSHQLSSTSVSPASVPDLNVKGVALVPESLSVENPAISFKSGQADIAWQHLNEKLDLLLRTDSYRSISETSQVSSMSDVPRSPKRQSISTDDHSNNQHHNQHHNHHQNGHSDASRKATTTSNVSSTTQHHHGHHASHSNGHGAKSESVPPVVSSGVTTASSGSVDLSRVLDAETVNNKTMLKKKSSRSLMKRLSSYNVMVDNTLYIDDSEEEEEVYGVAMRSKEITNQQIEDVLRLHSATKSHDSSDDDDVKPIKVRDLRRAASYVYDQREAQSEVTPPPSSSSHGTVGGSVSNSPREESLSDKQKREYEEKVALLEKQAAEQQMQLLLYQQQLQLQQQQDQQRLYEQQQLQIQQQQQLQLQQQQQQYVQPQAQKVQPPVEPPKTLNKTLSIEQMALAYIKEAQHLANAHNVKSATVNAVVAVTESWKSSPAQPHPKQLEVNSYPTSYPPLHSPQKQINQQQHQVTNTIEDFLAMGLSPAEANALFQEHVQALSQTTSQVNSRSNSRASSPALVRKISNVNNDLFVDNPLNTSLKNNNTINNGNYDFIDRTLSVEVDMLNIYDESHHSPRPPVPHKYVPTRIQSTPQMIDSPQLSARSQLTGTPTREDYPPIGKLKKSNSSSKYISDDVSVSSQRSAGSKGDEPRSYVREQLHPQSQQSMLSPAQQALMMPPLHTNSPQQQYHRNNQYSLEHTSQSMESMASELNPRVYNRSYSNGVNDSNGRNAPLIQRNIEQQNVKLRPARLDDGRYSGNNSVVSSLSENEHQELQNSQPFVQQFQRSSSFSQQSGVHSYHSPPQQQSRQLRSPIPFANYISIMDDTRTPDDVALDLGLTLSKQESLYGCNMFDVFNPQDENEIQYLMTLGYSRNTAMEMIFDRSRRHL